MLTTSVLTHSCTCTHSTPPPPHTHKYMHTEVLADTRTEADTARSHRVPAQTCVQALQVKHAHRHTKTHTQRRARGGRYRLTGCIHREQPQGETWTHLTHRQRDRQMQKKVVVLHQGHLPPGDIWQGLETFLIVITWGGEFAIGI